MKTVEEMIKIIKDEEELKWKLYQEFKKVGNVEMANNYRTQHSAIMSLIDELEINK